MNHNFIIMSMAANRFSISFGPYGCDSQLVNRIQLENPLNGNVRIDFVPDGLTKM
jgi:hypothetical protein